MKEFPHRHYQIVKKLRQSTNVSTFLAKPHNEVEDSVILKLYCGTTVRSKSNALVENLHWQRGLSHPHLLGITTAGISGRNSLFTIRQYSSETLDLAKANLTQVTQLLDVVSFIHQHGRIHGRLKPSNLFSVQGSLRLTDMRISNSDEISCLDDIRFSAPEVLLGAAPTRESDYYALGAILYRIYSGRDPFDDSHLENLKEKYLNARIPRIGTVCKMRESLAVAIDGLLHSHPRRRAAAFGELVREVPFTPESASRAPMIGRWEKFEQLYSRISTTTHGALTVEVIEGDAGIGKSRLIEEVQFRCHLNNSGFYSTACIEKDERSLTPILKLVCMVLKRHSSEKNVGVRALLGTFESNLAPYLIENLDNPIIDRTEYPSERLVQDLISLLSLLSRKEPLRLCIEDIDKSEPATQSFIRQLCYRASDLNVRLLLTCRNSAAVTLPAEIEALLGQTFTLLRLGPLARSESSELSRYLQLSPRKQKQILDLADGNPMWLLEHATIENNQVLATSVLEAISEQADPVLLKLVRVIAISGSFASFELLVRVSGLESEIVRRSLTKLRAMGAVREVGNEYDIRIEGLRVLIESKLSAPERRKIFAALYESLSAEKAVSIERLADAAAKGGLWHKASTHLAELARIAVRRGDNVSVLNSYERLRRVLRRLNKTLPAEAEIEMAVCFARIGKTRKAEQILQRSLTQSEISENLRLHLSLLWSGGEIDRSNLSQRLQFLQKEIESPTRKQLHPSILFGKLCNSLVAIGDFIGARDALKRAQEELEKVQDTEGFECVTGAEAFVLSNTGELRAALERYELLSHGKWGLSAAALTNQAFCLEHLGDIRTAVVIQFKAFRLARKAGLLVGQLLCLGNLGAFNSKLGRFIEARQCFGEMKQSLSELGIHASISFKGVEAEVALLEFLEGRYSVAIQHLRVALNSASLLRNIRFQSQMFEAEITSTLRNDVRESDFEEIEKEGIWTDSPLYTVQLALLRSRTKTAVSDALSELNEALQTARRSSLLYEVCRLELEIADRMHASDPVNAKSHAEEALRISKKNGYRPLQCRALLLRALCSSHSKEKEHYLSLALKLATSVGIPETISESSYHLGVHYESTNQPAAARECFSNSTRITSELVEQVPVKYRSAYLARPWRKDARKRHEERLLDRPLRLHGAEHDPGFRDHPYFRALYRISISASSSRTIDEFLRALLPAIGHAREGIVAMLTVDGHTSWHSHGVALTDALRHRVQSVAVKARGQARYNSNDRWIPFRSALHSGGICVLSRKGNQMGEEEMEFFTILGIFASSALDQIHNRVTSVPAPISIDAFQGIVGNSRQIRELCDHVSRIANNTATVLIQGETGTGKELVARAIHKLSSRSKGPFVPIDCGAISESLLESELFGSKRGSYTGAIADRPGVFEAAHTGTLFLDEISNMNLAMQAKLLRVLQEKEVRRIGETRYRPVDVRLVAASNTNLKQLVAEGSFRQDLLFRLNVISVTIPPLRSRRDDIPMLASHFLKQLNSAHKAGKVFGPKALEALLTYSFPGNVRELQNSVERGFFTASGQKILSIPMESSPVEESVNEVRKWLTDLADGRRNFWTEIHDRYKRRDISREKVVALIDLGLRTTRGSYKNLASLLHIQEREYRRLMDFLRRNNCLLDFRPYRKVASHS